MTRLRTSLTALLIFILYHWTKKRLFVSKRKGLFLYSYSENITFRAMQNRIGGRPQQQTDPMSSMTTHHDQISWQPLGFLQNHKFGGSHLNELPCLRNIQLIS